MVSWKREESYSKEGGPGRYLKKTGNNSITTYVRLTSELAIITDGRKIRRKGITFQVYAISVLKAHNALSKGSGGRLVFHMIFWIGHLIARGCPGPTKDLKKNQFLVTKENVLIKEPHRGGLIIVRSVRVWDIALRQKTGYRLHPVPQKGGFCGKKKDYF